MKEFLQRLFLGGTREFRGHETACLHAFRQAMNDRGREILDEQLGHLRLVQRSVSDKAVLVFLRDQWHRSKFPNGTAEVYAGRATLRALGAKPEIRCDIVLSRGLLAQLQFQRPPGELRDGFGLTAFELSVDPMVPAPIPLEAQESRPAPALLQELGAVDVRPAAESPQRERFLKWLDAAVPRDYLSLLEHTNRFRAGSFEFLGTEASRVVRKEGNLFLVAKTPRLGLCVHESNPAFEFFLFNEEHDVIDAAGPSFMDAVKKLQRLDDELARR